jgi:hypothetical protein
MERARLLLYELFRLALSSIGNPATYNKGFTA